MNDSTEKTQIQTIKAQENKLEETPVGEIMNELGEARITPKEFNLLVAVLTSQNQQEAFAKSGYKDRRYFFRKKAQLRPLLDKVCRIFQAKAIGQLAIAAPKAAATLSKMLDELEGSTSDTRRKVAVAILDRAIGKPVARVGVKEDTDEKIEISFSGWDPKTPSQASYNEVLDNEIAQNA